MNVFQPSKIMNGNVEGNRRPSSQAMFFFSFLKIILFNYLIIPLFYLSRNSDDAYRPDFCDYFSMLLSHTMIMFFLLRRRIIAKGFDFSLRKLLEDEWIDEFVYIVFRIPQCENVCCVLRKNRIKGFEQGFGRGNGAPPTTFNEYQWKLLPFHQLSKDFFI